jgi:serine/threonine protein phosphatase PrpC
MFRNLLVKFAKIMRRLGERLEQYAISQRDDNSMAEQNRALAENDPPEGGPQADGKEMTQDNATAANSPWRIIGESVTGASHERTDLPNQDSIGFLPESGHGTRAIVAISDGHGGAKYFRSDVGAKLAVETATQVVDEFIRRQDDHFKEMFRGNKEGNTDQPNLSETNHLSLIKRAAEESVPKSIVKEWGLAVKKHLMENEIKLAEMRKLNDKEHLAYRQYEEKYHQALGNGGDPESLRESKEFLECEAKLIQAYGATLLAAAITEEYVIYWQLGDGDIINVSTHGKVSRVMQKDDRLFANETTSLCTEKAWRDFRIVPLPLAEDVTNRPALIMLSTDGYSNSYSTPEGFERVGADLLGMMREEKGVEKVEENLKQWLKETSEGGSGDDITVCLILRQTALQERAEAQVDEGKETGTQSDSGKDASASSTDSAAARESVESNAMGSGPRAEQSIQVAQPSGLTPNEKNTT